MTIFNLIYLDSHSFSDGNIQIQNISPNLTKAYIAVDTIGLQEKLEQPLLLGFLYQVDGDKRSRPYPVVSQRQSIALDFSTCDKFLFVPTNHLIDQYTLALWVSSESGGGGSVDLTNYALISQLPDMTNYALKSEIPTVPSLANYALKSEIPTVPSLANYALKSEIPSLTNYALKSEIPDLTPLANRISNLESGIITTYPQKIKLNGSSNRGLFWYLGTQGTDEGFIDPITRGTITGLMSSVFGASFPKGLVDRVSAVTHTLNSQNEWFGFDLGANRSILLDRYYLRSRTDSAGQFLQRWVLEGTNSVSANTVAGFNGATWTQIDSQMPFTGLSGLGFSASFPTSLDTYFRYIRLRQTGVNSNNDYYLTLSAIEFFGVLKITGV